MEFFDESSLSFFLTDEFCSREDDLFKPASYPDLIHGDTDCFGKELPTSFAQLSNFSRTDVDSFSGFTVDQYSLDDSLESHLTDIDFLDYSDPLESGNGPSDEVGSGLFHCDKDQKDVVLVPVLPSFDMTFGSHTDAPMIPLCVEDQELEDLESTDQQSPIPSTDGDDYQGLEFNPSSRGHIANCMQPQQLPLNWPGQPDARFSQTDGAKRPSTAKVGRPRKSVSSISSGSSDEERSVGCPSPRKKRRIDQPWKGLHLWEFILDLLEGREKCEQKLVVWENRQGRVFRIVNSTQVAALWGLRKKNYTMNYEKLSRSLRWCRSSGFLTDVPKDGPYPKKLVFCFGPRATVD